MAFSWTADRIRWYLDASRCGDFHQKLADVIEPHLLPGDRLCDLGCGLGQLDLRLAPMVSHITCVDIDESVLVHLERQARETGAANLAARCCDVAELDGRFDVVLMTFFGHPPRLMFDCMRRASRKLIRVVHAHAGGAGRKRETVRDIAAALEEAGCVYQLTEGRFEFGQPLRSLEEARAFVLCNSPGLLPRQVDGYLRQRLEETGRADFPLYLPGEKALGIFVIDVPDEAPANRQSATARRSAGGN